MFAESPGLNAVEHPVFDVWLTRVGCDGTVVRLPAQVDSQDGPGAIEPQIAVNRHGVLVAYQTDTPGAEHNLDLVARSFTPDGAPFDAVERVLELSRDGEPNPGNAWMPTLTATQDAFAIAAAWGHDDAPAFQVLLQEILLNLNHLLLKKLIHYKFQFRHF